MARPKTVPPIRDMKTCKRCNRSLPLIAYNKAKAGVQGVAAVCKDCLKKPNKTTLKEARISSEIARNVKLINWAIILVLSGCACQQPVDNAVGGAGVAVWGGDPIEVAATIVGSAIIDEIWCDKP